MSFGLMGGGMQAQGHVQFLLNMFVFDMDVQKAIDAARFRHLDGLRVAIESPVTDDVRAALRAMGHDIVDELAVSFGGAQAIIRFRAATLLEVIRVRTAWPSVTEEFAVASVCKRVPAVLPPRSHLEVSITCRTVGKCTSHSFRKLSFPCAPRPSLFPDISDIGNL